MIETSPISVAIPVFNRAHTVLRALASVAAQTLRPARVIVIDDGSTDDSVACVSRWVNEHKGRFGGRLVRQPNRGVSSARNRGLAEAVDCPLVAFLDSDDEWPSDFLARTSSALADCPVAVAATCDRKLSACEGRASVVEDLASLAAAPIVWMMKHGAGFSSATLFRRSAIERHGGFDESLATGEDAALYLPLCLDGAWLHVPGRPVMFDRGSTLHDGEEANLSGKFPDNHRRWARVFENFILHGGGGRVVAPAEYRRLLCKRWYSAGRELARAGIFAEAGECFYAALAWHPWSWKTWQRLVENRLAMRFSRAAVLDAKRAA
jgi:glycosyltransferase involved in cell wall biosynthesis